MNCLFVIFFLVSSAFAGDINVYFSPSGGCTRAIVSSLNASSNSVLVQAYSFTSAPIASALIEAEKRGVNARVILDKSQTSARGSRAGSVAAAGIPVFIDSRHNIAHNKIMVIDGSTVITGSFNFTSDAEYHNAENLLVIHDSDLAKTYTTNWMEHLNHSKKLDP